MSNIFTQSFVSIPSTLLLATDPLLIIHLDKSNHSGTIVSLPSQIVVEGSLGYGYYPLSSLWQLSQIDRRPQLLGFSIATALAIAPPDYLFFSEKLLTIGDPVEFITKTFAWPQLFSTVFSTSSLNPLQVFGFARVLGTVELAKVNLIDLGSSAALTNQILPDGSRESRLDPQLVDQALGLSFQDRFIRAEALRIRIQNPTAAPGLASQYARELSRLGLVVVAVENSEDLREICLLKIAKNHLDSRMAKYIRKRFSCQIETQESQEVVTPTLVLGKNNLLP